MVRLHRSSILLAALSIAQIGILFVANAAASSGPAPGRYKIARPDRAMVVNEFELVGTDKINGDIWEVISIGQHGTYTLNDVTGQSFLSFVKPPVRGGGVFPVENVLEAGKFRLQRIHGTKDTYRIVPFGKPPLSIQEAASYGVMLRDCLPDSDTGDQWTFVHVLD
ncbi:hypothetical protein BGX24_002414 [Mortierella sp. AD032]|nr:hypothetical protein BGX24_002414 [Mortierella sp. AD032]